MSFGFFYNRKDVECDKEKSSDENKEHESKK
jgi:hypothetical protein